MSHKWASRGMAVRLIKVLYHELGNRFAFKAITSLNSHRKKLTVRMGLEYLQAVSSPILIYSSVYLIR